MSSNLGKTITLWVSCDEWPKNENPRSSARIGGRVSERALESYARMRRRPPDSLAREAAAIDIRMDIGRDIVIVVVKFAKPG
jgi:hypothetical protein